MGRLRRAEILKNIEFVLSSESREIGNLTTTLNEDSLCQVIEVLENCRGKIITCGCGTSGAAGEKIAHTLSCIEMPSLFLSPAEANHGGMGVIQKGDVLILISKGGHTEELEKIVVAAGKKGAATICVTENEESFLAKHSDIILKIKVSKEPDPFNMLATASTLSVISTFDAIAITIAQDKGFKKEDFLLIHPGGEVGEKLYHDVSQEER